MTTNPTDQPSPSYPEDISGVPAGHTRRPENAKAVYVYPEQPDLLESAKKQLKEYNSETTVRVVIECGDIFFKADVFLDSYELALKEAEFIANACRNLNSYADSQRKIGELREGIKCAVECAPSIFLRDKFAALLKSTE